MKKRIFVGLGAVLLLLPFLFLAQACQKKQSEAPKTKKQTKLLKTPYKNEEFAAGTYVQILIYDKGHGEADFQVLNKKLRELATKFEIYEQGQSELDEVNDQAGLKPVKVSKVTFELAQALDKYAKESNGLYNPAVGVMTHLWHIGFSDAQVPHEDLIKATLDKVDYQDIVLDKANQTIFLKKKGMKIEADGIAKGFIGKKLLETLAIRGVTTAVVNLGGHAYTMGENPNHPDGSWEVGVANPSLGETQDTPLVGVIRSKHTSFNTTSYYGRYLKVGDKLYSHLFDTKTGYPLETNLLSVTVIGNTPYHDDAYSNAIFNMGLEKGMAFINEHDELDAIFITNDKKVYISKNIPEEFDLLDKSFEVMVGTSKK
jgi:thiamine biosynthesis lipoprotein